MTAATTEHTVKVGDFFYSSWGYDQTNVDFYKVVGVTAKGVKIQQWSSAAVRSDGYSMRLVPGEGPHTSPRWRDGVMVGEVAAPVEQETSPALQLRRSLAVGVALLRRPVFLGWRSALPDRFPQWTLRARDNR